MDLVLKLSCIALLFAACVYGKAPATPNEWSNLALEQLKSQLNNKENRNVAKNIILFLGDGMGIPTLTAARILKGQLNLKQGETEFLEFERFPNAGLLKTFSVNAQVADSAPTATALFTGCKTNKDMIGVNSESMHADCSNVDLIKCASIMTLAQEAGKATGIVTQARITHATPAATYAHSVHRNWEYDAKIPSNMTSCQADIARQLVENEPGTNFDVIFGGGRRAFYSDHPFFTASRKDGRNLVEQWKQLPGGTRQVVVNRKDFMAIDPQKVDKVLGLFDSSHMKYNLDNGMDMETGKWNLSPNGLESEQPTLTEMTEKAIKMLQKNGNGFVLMVEGARIDHSHHEGKAGKALYETVEMDRAVRKALDMTDQKDTLIAVTADHSHTMTIGGYAERGDPILGGSRSSDVDEVPFLTLSYANGPGAPLKTGDNGQRVSPWLRANPLVSKEFIQDATIPMTEETHGGEDVAVYAIGPYSHLFNSLNDNHFFYYATLYASCMPSQNLSAEYKARMQFLNDLPKGDHCYENSVSRTKPGLFVFFFVVALIFGRLM